MGVEVREGSPVEQVDEHGVVVSGEYIEARRLILERGVLASPAGKWLGAEVDRAGRVKVESDLSVPGHPNVFVIGDTASVTQNGKQLPGVALVAMQAGHYVASLIMQRIAGKEQHKPFHYLNKGNLATVGRSYALVDLGIVKMTGFLAWATWLVYIFYLIGFRNRVVALFQWAWTYLTYARGARLITLERDFK